MKKIINIITTITLIIVWIAVIVGFVRGNSLTDDIFLLFLFVFAIATTIEKVIYYFENRNK